MSGIFADHRVEAGKPRFYQAPPGAHLSRLAARGLMRRLGWPDRPDPVSLARVTIYVGARRAARALQQAFAEEAEAFGAGGPVLIPRIRAFPDLPPPPDLPPAVPPLRRILTFAQLVRGLGRATPDLAREEAAAALAGQIADLLDEMHEAKIDPQDLLALAPENHAEHWEKSLRFLQIASAVWPERCAELDVGDAAALRVAALEARIKAWEAKPPAAPVLVLGEAGGSAVERDFIRAAARLPQGAAILPWLDMTLGGEEWLSLENHPEHPSAELSALLRLDGVARESVPWWEAPPDPALWARARIWGQALRPPPFTDEWRAEERQISEAAPAACAGLSLIEARSPREEAAAVAAVMRRALADPTKTVALVAPDRALGRRVAAALARWDVQADDSGGRPLALTPPGVFVSLLARVLCVEPGEALSAADFLSLLKHPLTAADDEAEEARDRRREHLRLARRYELFALRGRRAAPGLEGLRDAIRRGLEEARRAAAGRSDPEAHVARAEAEAVALTPWFEALAAKMAPLAALSGEAEVDCALLLAAHRQAALDLTEGAVERHPTGEALADFLDRLQAAAGDLGPVTPAAWPALFADLLRGEAARPPGGGHRRAFIWGPADARAQKADVIILGGLNEGVWPEIRQPDGWLSRPMRKTLGLPPLEAEAGRLALDFSRIACGASEVWLTRSRKQGGAPASASRWLRRLEILLGGFAPQEWAAMRGRGEAALRAALAAEVESGPPRPEPAPAPRPPARRRPSRLSVTAVETLARDPYAIYARHVLGLSALPELDAEPDALLRGRVYHAALEDFVEATRAGLPPEPEARRIFVEALERALESVADRPALQESWRARGLGFAEAFLRRERETREAGEAPRLLEARGEMRIPLASGRVFKLTAMADRIDRGPEGFVLVDYKTGGAPSAQQVKDYARQLPLEAAILRAGGFAGLEASEGAPIGALRYVEIKPGAKETDFSGSSFQKLEIADLAAFADETLADLTKLLEDYDKPETPYRPKLRPRHLVFASDYDHLSRLGEWGGEPGEEEGGGEA